MNLLNNYYLSVCFPPSIHRVGKKCPCKQLPFFMLASLFAIPENLVNMFKCMAPLPFCHTNVM